MLDSVRTAEKALGEDHFGVSPREESSRQVIVCSARCEARGEVHLRERALHLAGTRLHTCHLSEVLDKRAACAIERGPPLSWDLIAKSFPLESTSKRGCATFLETFDLLFLSYGFSEKSTV